jgi:hypothetical protein
MIRCVSLKIYFVAGNALPSSTLFNRLANAHRSTRPMLQNSKLLSELTKERQWPSPLIRTMAAFSTTY